MSKILFSTLFSLALGLSLGACRSDDNGEASTKSDMSTNDMAKAKPQPTTTTTTKPSTSTGTTTKPSTSAPAKATLGMMAPDFTLTDLDGKTVKLSDFRGKTVVLEWFNPECPYVVYAYGEGPLKTLAKDCAKDGVVWLSINSGAAGKQGAAREVNTKAVADWNMSSKVLIDADGSVGRAYGAKTTPHCYVIDGKGTLVYRGALDNSPRGQMKGTAFENYVQMALDDVKSGAKVRTSETDPYGCGVKYAQ